MFTRFLEYIGTKVLGGLYFVGDMMLLFWGAAVFWGSAPFLKGWLLLWN